MLWICSDNKTSQASANCFCSFCVYYHIWASNAVQYNNLHSILPCPDVSHMNNWGTRWSKELSKFSQEVCSRAGTKTRWPIPPENFKYWTGISIAAGTSIPQCNPVFCCRTCLWFSYISLLLIPSTAIQEEWGISMQGETVVGDWTERRSCRVWKGDRERVKTQQPEGEI